MSKKLAIEILNDYPLATESARDWFMSEMKKSLEKDNVSEEFREGMLRNGIPDATLAIMLETSPRNFFDFLDHNKLYIHITPIQDDKKVTFKYSVNHKVGEKVYKNRIDCERDAVIEALEQLN